MLSNKRVIKKKNFFILFFSKKKFLHNFFNNSNNIFNFNGSQNQTISLINCKKDSDNGEDGNGAYH